MRGENQKECNLLIQMFTVICAWQKIQVQEKYKEKIRVIININFMEAELGV